MISDITVASLLPFKYSDNEIENGLKIEFACSGIILFFYNCSSGNWIRVCASKLVMVLRGAVDFLFSFIVICFAKMITEIEFLFQSSVVVKQQSRGRKNYKSVSTTSTSLLPI